jgi:hypothetical protein
MSVSGSTATPQGAFPTLIVAVTAFVLVSITDTVFEPELATYKVCVAASTASPVGLVPTEIVFVTASVVPLITETVLERKLPT